MLASILCWTVITQCAVVLGCAKCSQHIALSSSQVLTSTTSPAVGSTAILPQLEQVAPSRTLPSYESVSNCHSSTSQTSSSSSPIIGSFLPPSTVTLPVSTNMTGTVLLGSPSHINVTDSSDTIRYTTLTETSQSLSLSIVNVKSGTIVVTTCQTVVVPTRTTVNPLQTTMDVTLSVSSSQAPCITKTVHDVVITPIAAYDTTQTIETTIAGAKDEVMAESTTTITSTVIVTQIGNAPSSMSSTSTRSRSTSTIVISVNSSASTSTLPMWLSFVLCYSCYHLH